MCGQFCTKLMDKFYVADTRYKLNMLTMTVRDKELHRYLVEEQHHHFYGIFPALCLFTICGVTFNSVILILNREQIFYPILFEILIQLLFFAVFCTFKFVPYLRKRSYGQLTIFTIILGIALMNNWSAYNLTNANFKGSEETSFVNWVFFTYLFSTNGYMVHLVFVAPFLLGTYYSMLTGITKQWGCPYSELPVEEQNPEIISAYFNTHFTKFLVLVGTMTVRCYIRSYDQSKKAIEKAYMESQQTQLSHYFSAMTDGVLIYGKPQGKFDKTSRPSEDTTERHLIMDPSALFEKILLKNEAIQEILNMDFKDIAQIL